MARRARTGGPAFSLFAFQDIITCVMGIMLLLTLMMAMQVVVQPGTALTPEMQGEASSLRAEATSLLADIQSLEEVVSQQSAMLNSGAILNQDLLQRTRDIAAAETSTVHSEIARLNGLVDRSGQRLIEVEAESEASKQDVLEIRKLQAEREELRRKRDEIQTGKRRIYNRHDSVAKVCWLVEITSPQEIRAAVMEQKSPPVSFASMQELSDWVTSQKGNDIALMLLVKPSAANGLSDLTALLIKTRLPFGFDLVPQETVVIDPVSGAAER